MSDVTVQPTRDQLRALADAATPGPWEAEAANGGVFHVAVHPHPEGSVALDAEQADAEFIAAARTAVPQLLDQLDQADAEIKRLSWKCGHLADKYAQDTEELRQEVAQAEARIKAVRDVLDAYEEENVNTPHRHPTPHGDGLGPTLVDAGDIRRALEEGTHA